MCFYSNASLEATRVVPSKLLPSIPHSQTYIPVKNVSIFFTTYPIFTGARLNYCCFFVCILKLLNNVVSCSISVRKTPTREFHETIYNCQTKLVGQ